jgi:thiamine-triphosphatase
MELEVEQKFGLMEEGAKERVENRLDELGFTLQNDEHMVDLYFDVEAPRWVLTPQDCWLRYRECGDRSCWQLKRGRVHERGATIYEELEGDDAFGVALSMLAEENPSLATTSPKEDDEEKEEYEGHRLPELPKASSLVPFAKIETHRSSWKPASDGQYSGLIVDLDSTQFGYIVGEVEAVVYNEEEVEKAHQRIKALISDLLPDIPTSEPPAVGKLETFMMKYRPEHYEACIIGGSIQRRTDKA